MQIETALWKNRDRETYTELLKNRDCEKYTEVTELLENLDCEIREIQRNFCQRGSFFLTALNEQ